MNLQEHIRKVLREEKKIPAYILRRLNFSNISDDMKKNSLRMFKKGVSLNSAIIEGAVFTTGEIIPWHDTEGREYEHYVYIDWFRIFEEYLIENYGKETEEYLLKVLPEDSFSNDGNKYVFWKHSEINGGNGFSDTFNSWGDLILNYGWKFPLNWWEIKSELDNISEGRKIILRPGDKHNNLGYHFSIIKKKSNIQETIRRVLREEVSENDLVVYHGTDDKHEFNKEGIMFNGTFFSLSKNEAKSYGKYVYEVLLEESLVLIDTNKFEDCELIIDEFGTLIDPYYDEDEDDYYITEPEQLYYNSDSWSAIESNDDVMEWLEGNYDGVWIYEGGVRNLLLFKPIKEKIKRIKLLNDVNETILKEDLEKETIFILRRINQPGFVNKLELLVYDIVDTLNPCEYATAFNFFYQVMEVVVYYFVNDFIEFYDLDVLNDWLPTERVVKFIVKEKYEDFIRHTFEGRVCR